MSTSSNLTRAQRRARAQRAARRYHPSFKPKVRQGSPISRVIATRTERHTQTITAIHRIANAPEPHFHIDDTERLLWAIFGNPPADLVRYPSVDACPKCNGQESDWELAE